MEITRRTFVQGTMLGGAAVATGTLASGCGNPVNAPPTVPVTVETDPGSPHFGQVTVDVTAYPELLRLGGALTLELEPPSDPTSLSFPVPAALLLVHLGALGAPVYLATQSACPHQGCPLGYSTVDKLIECPCHGSRFTATADSADPSSCAGRVVHLPAMANLTTWKVTTDGDTLYIDLKTTGCAAIASGLPPVMDGKVSFTVADLPMLAMVGGSITGMPSGLSDTLIVARVSSSKVVALSAICTHQGCTVNYTPGRTDFECPCHGSTFNLAGMVTNPPAPLPLKSYPVTFDGTTVTIDVA